ncbi:MAG: alkaline phosphatase family protein, partial [Balneolaceae bacterium]|nr:alkaline phosphatase family protein [Balneolaceae bacterium]
PENTMAAFKRAHELGADVVEIDLYTSSDGHLFILHDSTLDRTTDGEGKATELTLEELQALDAGSWFGSEFTGEHIPSFREVLDWATRENVVLLLDLKETGWDFATNVASDVQSYGIEENMVVGVRSPEQAGEFRELMPRARQLAFMRSPDDIEAYSDEGVDVLRLWLRWLDEDPTLANRVKKTGKKLMINGTLGELDEGRRIMNFEPDWILIDDIVQLKESLLVITLENKDEFEQVEHVNTGSRHLVIVVDGLRPDYVTPEIMPHVFNMGEHGVVGERSAAVFPTFTRPNRTAIPTGSYPGTHGVVHNELYHPKLESSIHSGNLNQMTEFENVTGTPMVTTISLGEMLEQNGDRLLSVGYASWLLNHKATGKGWQMPGNFQPAEIEYEIIQAVGEAPGGGRTPELTSWTIDLYLHDSLGDDPAEVVLMWIGVVDAVAHAYGVGAPETLEAVSHVDAEIGRILQVHQDHGLSNQVNIFVTSDHGFTQSKGGFNTSNLLRKANLENHVDVARNMFFVKSGEFTHKEQLVEVMHRDENVGTIYSLPSEPGSIEGKIPGTLSTDLIHWTHERSSDILASPAWNDEKNEFGWKGTTTRGGTATHGSDSPFDIHIPLIAYGPDIKSGIRSSVPTGNIDFTPTILHLRGISPPASMDGRILHELLKGGPDPASIEIHEYNHGVSKTYPDGFYYETELKIKRVGSTSYLQSSHTVRKESVEELD